MMPAQPAPAYVPRRPAPPNPTQNGAGKGRTPQPKPLVRAQAPEEPKPARPPLLTLPSPEQLGVAVRPSSHSPRSGSGKGGAADWTALHVRMKELGVLSYHMDSLPDGQSRFTCWMPSDRPGLTRRIESIAATEAEAVQRGLQEAGRPR